MTASMAPALPRLVRSSRTFTPVLAAISAVESLDESETT